VEVLVDGWAWLPKEGLTPDQIVTLKKRLTVIPVKTGDHPGDDPAPIPIFQDSEDFLGVPRQFFFENRRPVHQVNLQVSEGSDEWHPAEFSGNLRPEQGTALREICTRFRAGQLGGIIQAKPGWGKTVTALAIAAELGVPTLVVVHKEFLMDQWKERVDRFLPGAKVGHVQQDYCDFRGKTIVMGMVHSLGSKAYPEDFYSWPGLLIVDECHRIGARTWAPVPPRFHAKYRLGFTATPRRKDRADDVFFQHLGPILFAGKEQRLTPKIKRVWSKFKLVKTDRFNPNLANRSLLLRFLCASRHRNDLIVDQVIGAVVKGRKCIVLSERLNHLERMENRLKEIWPMEYGAVPSTGWYVGGRKKEQLARAAEAQVILATSQYAAEGLDIPALDTLFLTTPMSDVEQAVGRIQRPHPGKKDPIVVDFRDDTIPMFEAQGRKRDRLYSRIT
jgi:superfamily II DNA or RNA helicase